MSKKIIIPSVLVAIGVGAAISLVPAPPKHPEIKLSSVAMPAINDTNAETQMESRTPSSQPVAMAPAVAALPSPSLEKSKKFWADYKFHAELDKFAMISNKALLLEHDKVAKKKLITDVAFIRSLKSVLLTAALDNTMSHNQNIAVDFLFEALKGSQHDEVVKVLQAVAADPAVDNEQTDMASRKALAGVKAEVLFTWSAVDPDADANIAAALPGPVSQKIWANVKKQQENNLAESASLATEQ